MKKKPAKQRSGSPPQRPPVQHAQELLAPFSPTPADTNHAGEQRWQWHFKRLLQLREHLLRETAERRAAALEPLEPHSMDLADTASDEIDHDLSLAELSAEQNLLYEIDEALNRIRAGVYGLCQETGQPIPAARLRAIPWARFSMDVESRLERTGQVTEPHLGGVQSVTGSNSPSLDEHPPEPTAEDESLQEIAVPFEPLATPAREHGASRARHRSKRR